MNKKRHVFVVEDDISILTGLEANLKMEGYKVSKSMNGSEALKLLHENQYDMVLLDIMLPGINGFEVCKKLKIAKPEIPVIMLTARSSEIDKIAGLDYGADDYITKPFSLSELLARVRALMRRSYSLKDTFSNYSFGTIEIDFKKMFLKNQGKPIKFSKKEFDIMHYFISHEGEVVHRHDLLNEVWGYDKVPTTRTVDNYILDIRKKIEEKPSSPKHITTISGVGYRFHSQVT